MLALDMHLHLLSTLHRKLICYTVALNIARQNDAVFAIKLKSFIVTCDNKSKNTCMDGVIVHNKQLK